jgi:dihydroorotase
MSLATDLADIKVNPPIRRDEDRKAVLQAIREGKIDFLATDHAPHTEEEKQCGACGISGLDLYGHMVAWLLFKEEIPVENIYKMCCERPRQFLSHFMDLNLLPLSLSILKREETIADRYNFKSKGKYSPYHGMKFPGHAYLYDLHEGEK